MEQAIHFLFIIGSILLAVGYGLYSGSVPGALMVLGGTLIGIGSMYAAGPTIVKLVKRG